MEPVIRQRTSQLPLLALLVIAPALFFLPINHDAVWQMWIGRQMLHGVGLYSEIVEVNPPLWFWIATPLAWIAETLQVPGTRVLVGFFVASIGLSCWLSTRFERRPAFLAAFVVAVIPLGGFGQREHFALIATIPYVLLIWKRDQGERVSPALATAVGLFAASGFALKPHFALVPIALELWYRGKHLRPETIALGSAAVAYILAALLFVPAYFTETLPLVDRAYLYFGPLLVKGLVFGVAALLFTAPLISRTPLLIAALAYFLAALLQGKMWGYHVIAANGFLLLGLSVAHWGKSLWRDALAVCAAILMLVPRLTPYHNDVKLDVPAHTSTAVLSYGALPAWPLVDDRQWPLRYMTLWTLAAIIDGGDRELLRELRQHVAHDLACNPPEIIVTDKRKVDVGAIFPEALGYYRAYRETPEFRFMRRASLPPRPRDCRRIY